MLAKTIGVRSYVAQGASEYTSVASLALRRPCIDEWAAHRGWVTKARAWLPKATSFGGQLGRFAGRVVFPVGMALTLYDVATLSFELGQEYGPSKWYGDDDEKWFK